jgi:hypothetical protein
MESRAGVLLTTMESGVMLIHGLIIVGQVHNTGGMDPFAVVARVQQL